MTTATAAAGASTLAGAADAGAAGAADAGKGAAGAGAGAGAAGAGAAAAGNVDPNSEAGKAAAADAAKVTAEKTAAELAAKPFTDAAQLKIPEGLKLDDGSMKEFLPVAGKLGLTAAQAQGLIEYQAAQLGAVEKSTAAAQLAAQTAAQTALKADKDFGGANFEKSMKAVTKALTKFGGPEVRKFLNTPMADGSLAGENLALAKLFAAFGSAMAEDSIGSARAGANATATKSLGELLYGPGTVEAGPNQAQS